MHLYQNQFFCFGILFKLVQLRWHQSKHLSQIMRSFLTISLWHVEQYHCMFSFLASKINAFPHSTLLKYPSNRYTSMLFESRIVSKILAMHRKCSGITPFLPSNALSTTTLSFIKHSRMIWSFSFGPNQENGSGFLLQLCFFLGNPITVVSARLGHLRFDIFSWHNYF